MPSPHRCLPPPRLVASGGPVSAAISAVRDESPAAELAHLRGLLRSIENRITADLRLIEHIERVIGFGRAEAYL